jgi:hypothetical protein
VKRGDEGARRALRWSALAGVLIWLPPVLDQVAGEGNLSSIVEFLLDPGAPAVGWANAFGVFGVQLHPLGAWVTGDDLGSIGLGRTRSPVLALVVVGLLAVASVGARRRGAVDAGRLGFVLLVAVGLGLVATANISGLVAPYLYRWWWLVGGLVMAALVHAAVAASRRPALDRAVTVAAGAGLAVVTAVLVAQAPAEFPLPHVSTALGAVADDTADALDADRRYLIRVADTSSFGAPGVGMQLELESRGFEVFSDRTPGAELGVGAGRLASIDEVDGLVSIISIDDYEAGIEPPAGSRLIAEFDPLTASERERARELDALIRRHVGAEDLQRQLDLRGGVDYRDVLRSDAPRAEVEELRRLQLQGEGLLVFLSPAGG